MDSARLIDAFLFLAWLFPLLVTIHYYRTAVRSRLREIKGVFFSGNFDRERFNGEARDHPACRYAERFGLDCDDKDLEKPIREQFHRYQSAAQYVLPVALTLVFSGCGLWLCREWIRSHALHAAADAAGVTASAPARGFPPPAVVMALAGADVWSVWELLNRSHTGDLTPAELYDVAFRWVAAVPIGHAFSLLAGSSSFQPAFAFAASAFPVKDVQRLVRQWSLKKLGETVAGQNARPEERHLGKAVEGIGEAMLARLDELGIVTVLDIAYADPVRIMVKTGFPFLNIQDWIDQSILTLYAGDRRPAFAKAGIRCSVDVCEFVDMHLWDRARDQKKLSPTEDDRKAIDGLARELKMEEQLMLDLLYRIYFDPQVQLIYDLWYPSGAHRMLGGTQGSTAADAPS